ncbi:GNAT family N-acetyltransferase [Stieleria sp. JC731]|uniref:GNAT family N-acetyltransferase n=1 Tax=Pirellulaceae TaxID=2691357 RepID=UPI001E56E760|nr:GNAT family N-acetyltransferase [Stieleria sp. JC731]MCC9599810.1 GNAT family N-acetyltransferase [Stieleria sp. JC731]
MPVAELSSQNDSAIASETRLQVRFSRYNELLTLIPRWEALVERCIWTNPCYEPEFLLSLLRTIDIGSVRVLVAERGNELVGLMPIVSTRLYGLPIRAAEAWRPDEAFDSTPLLDSQFADETLQAFFASLRQAGYRLLSLNTASAEEPFEVAMANAITKQSLAAFRRDQFQRAALRPQGDIDDYLRRVLSKNRRKKINRALKNLESLGKVRFETAQTRRQSREWMEIFLDLEASGWKGNASTAFASEDDTLGFFVDVVGELIDSEKLQLTRLSVDGAPIAMLVDIRTQDHIACYKTAFDERYAEHSPGMLLEWHNVQRMFSQGISLCDSCGDPDNELLNTLYEDRLAFQHLVVSLHPWTNPVPRTVLPALQKLAQTVKRLRKP